MAPPAAAPAQPKAPADRAADLAGEALVEEAPEGVVRAAAVDAAALAASSGLR